MKTLFLLTTILFMISVAPVHAASGGGGGGRTNIPNQPRLTPEQKAAVRYDSGIKHRDKAAKYEQDTVGEQSEKKLAKLDKKIAKEYKKAIKDFEKAIGHYPDFYEVHGSLGYALRKVGRFDESLVAYNESLRLNPSYGNAIEYRGEAYLGLNRIDDAKQAYMTLYQSDLALADQLLAAMVNWVTSRREDAAGLDTTTVEQFASWVDERSELASYLRPDDSTTSGHWAEST